MGTVGLYVYLTMMGPFRVYSQGGALRGSFHEGALNVCFLRFISSQYVIKSPLDVGGRLLSVADQGWVEIMRGQGRILRVKEVVTKIQPLSRSVSTIIILVGIRVFVSSFII